MIAPQNALLQTSLAKPIFWRVELLSAAKGQAKVALDAGGTVIAGLADGLSPSGKVTLVVRPEHAQLVSDNKKATLVGKLENIVYFGTDTHFHVKLEKGGAFVVREQNNKAGPSTLNVGAAVGVHFAAGAAQVLKD